MKGKMFVFFISLLVSIGAVAQSGSITGLIISADDGEPVVGASVLVKGTSVGTITNIDGQFTITNVPTTAKAIVVSYIGLLSQEVAIKAGTMKVVMQSDAKA
ncbi:MAG: carboxypeptidase-like regulatory domain-containing protein, partial [Phocaeicola sp.]